jgi:type VI secretion system secreted protein VgrG
MMSYKWAAAVAALACVCLQAPASAQLLGSADSFALLAGSTVTNTGPTLISGNVGVSPGSTIAGFPPGIITNGSVHLANAVAEQAKADLVVAFNALAGEPSDTNLTGQDLGGMTLPPGVYTFNTSAQLTGTLTLDAQGDSNARFDFQIGSTLTSASNAAVTVINGGNARNVYWQVGSSATLGTGTAFAGHILAQASITLNTGATLGIGSAHAITGAVTLDTGLVSTGVIDNIRPMCRISGITATQIQVTGQDMGSGLALVQIMTATNLNVVTSPFVIGSTDPVTVTATKINNRKAALLLVRFVDVSGNITNCDPILTTVTIGPRARIATQRHNGIPEAESFVTVRNGTPGLSVIRFTVNGRAFTAHLKPGQTWSINVASAMRRGSRNTILISAIGAAGSSADVVIGDMFVSP